MSLVGIAGQSEAPEATEPGHSFGERVRGWADAQSEALAARAAADARYRPRADLFARDLADAGPVATWDRWIGRERRWLLESDDPRHTLARRLTIVEPTAALGDPTARSERGRSADLTRARDACIRELVAALDAWLYDWGTHRARAPVAMTLDVRFRVIGALDLLGEREGSGWSEVPYGRGCEVAVAALERDLVSAGARYVERRVEYDPDGRGWSYGIAAWLLGDVLTARAIKATCQRHRRLE